jgi:Tol biopolymer transport system component
MRSDGTHDNVLTTSPDSVYAIGPPSWSPDGRKIVFGRDRGSYYSADPHDLVIVDVLTGQTRALRADGATDDPVWGKPGIAYHAGSRIMLMNSMTGRSRPLAHGNGIDNLAWSPGGVLAVGEHTQIVLLAASGRVLGTLPFPPAMRRVCAISWSSDGRQILVATEKGTYTLRGLWVGTVRTQHWQRLPAAPIWRNYKYDCAASWR